jgi:ubiquinone/menaquinone biosynthesis C-methylase UbiE
MKKSETIRPNNIYSGKYLESSLLGQWFVRRFYKALASLAGDLDVATVLEIGCGHGYSLDFLKEIFTGKRLEASDFESALVSDAKMRHPDLLISEESIYGLKRGDESIDLALALEVLEHLEHPKKALEELHRVTKKYCILSVPREPLWRMLNLARGKYWRRLGNPYGHVNHWSKAEFSALVSEYFTIERIITPVPWVMVLAKK